MTMNGMQSLFDKFVYSIRPTKDWKMKKEKATTCSR